MSYAYRARLKALETPEKREKRLGRKEARTLAGPLPGPRRHVRQRAIFRHAARMAGWRREQFREWLRAGAPGLLR
jgi:hypothetical protein